MRTCQLDMASSDGNRRAIIQTHVWVGDKRAAYIMSVCQLERASRQPRYMLRVERRKEEIAFASSSEQFS